MVILPVTAQQATTYQRHNRIDIVSPAQRRRLDVLSRPVRTESAREGEKERESERDAESGTERQTLRDGKRWTERDTKGERLRVTEGEPW